MRSSAATRVTNSSTTAVIAFLPPSRSYSGFSFMAWPSRLADDTDTIRAAMMNTPDTHLRIRLSLSLEQSADGSCRQHLNSRQTAVADGNCHETQPATADCSCHQT